MRLRRFTMAALAATIVLTAAARADRVTVFAAASLGDALSGIASAFEAETGHDVVLSAAGSSALARQIAFGAPADIFISANADWMDLLEAEGHLAPETRVDLLSNRLVLVAHGAGTADPDTAPLIDAETDIAGMLGDGLLAMALVDAVPAGIYGKAALESLGQWTRLAPRVAQTDNVRAALALVAAGETPLAIVYATDAMVVQGVTVAGRFPADSHPPIVYPAAVIAGRATPAATALLAFLRGPEARGVFEAQGFTMLAEMPAD